jgi:hypothetical protein
MNRWIIATSLLYLGALAGCADDLDATPDEAVPVADVSAAVHGPGYCWGAGNPPLVSDPVYQLSELTKWCDNQRSVGLNGSVLHAGTNWAVCQYGANPGWYVWTQGDVGAGIKKGWDWFKSTDFSGGEGGGPIPGLVNCSVYGI